MRLRAQIRERRVSEFRSTIGVVLCLLTLAQAAWAYSPLAFLKDGVPGEEVDFIYWQEVFDNQPITVSIYDGGTPDIDLLPSDPAIDEFEAMELAFASWEQILGVPISFNILYTTTHELNGTDGENVIFFDDLGAVGYGGVTIITYDTNTGQILDADIHMNDNNISWFTSLNDVDGEPLEDLLTGTWVGGEYQNDIQGLSTHEIGHLLGLAHSAVGYRELGTTPTMYPRGVWNVPGDGARPANSYYRSLEPDDDAGIQEIYQPDCLVNNTGEISGLVSDLADEPLFGGHVVARDLSTQDEIGALSGVVRGSYTAGAYVLRLPPGIYELRVAPVDGSPPGLVGPWNYGGIANSLTAQKFPAEMDLELMYHQLVYDPADATPITVVACAPMPLDFRPIAKMQKLPRFVRMPQAFAIEGNVNVDVTGPVASAILTYTVDGLDPTSTDLPLDGSAFAVPIAKLPPGSLLEYDIEVQTTLSEIFVTLPNALQIGLSGEPLVLLSKHGAWELGAVDTRSLFEIDSTTDELVYPLGQAFHAGYSGVYVANFGSDTVSFVPFWSGELLALDVQPFDTDGDGLLDLLEPSFGTSAANPDSDGDHDMDGLEISELRFVHSNAEPSSFEVLGGTVANDGFTPMGSPYLNIAVWDVTNGGWITPSMRITPSGRFRLKLEADITYRVSYRYNRTLLINTSDFSGTSGEVVNVGVTQVPLEPPAPAPADTGTDPLDPLFSTGLFMPGSWSSYFLNRTTFLESSADSLAVVLSPAGSRAYVTGFGTDKVYEIDTASSQVVNQVVVGQSPTGLAITPDGSKLYVVNHDSEDLTVLNAATLGPITTIPLPGAAWSVGMTADGVSAVVTIGDSTNIVFIDVATDSVDQTLDLGFNGLYFLGGSAPACKDMVAGPFQFGTHELAMLDVPGRTGYTIDLGTDIDATAGLALHPDGARGYAVHYSGVELLEFDVRTGSVGRRYEFDWIDIRDILLIDDADADADGAPDGCDACPGFDDYMDSDSDGIPDGCDACPGAGLILTDEDIISTVVYEACTSITASDAFRILTPGNVTFRAGVQVIFGDGFSVGAGADFSVEIDPALAP